MVIEWIYILYLIIIVNTFGFAYLVLKSWYQLKKDNKAVNKTTSNYMMINKIKRRVDDIESYLTEGVPQKQPSQTSGGSSSSPLVLPNTLDEALKEWEIDSKLVDNPIVKPLAEKIYSQIKERASSHKQDEDGDMNIGY